VLKVNLGLLDSDWFLIMLDCIMQLLWFVCVLFLSFVFCSVCEVSTQTSTEVWWVIWRRTTHLNIYWSTLVEGNTSRIFVSF